MNPIETNFDPIGSVCNESLIGDRLDRLFSVESLGIGKNSHYDEYYINKFDSDINLVDGNYEVELPWTDKVNSVRHNFEVSKAILDRVVDKLYKNNLYDSYNSVLEQQLSDNIIEKVDLDNIDVRDHVWIPHRPVVKSQDNVTTKLRIVMNCSLKIGDSPSLNEAAYPGVDLLSNLFELLIKIRSNRYLVMSDIKQAFLMIKLKNEFDRNKFSILWRNPKGNLVAHRYSSIVFGFISSPFDLNHVIKHHISKNGCDEVFNILNNNLYVDNLFFTGNKSESLSVIYRDI